MVPEIVICGYWEVRDWCYEGEFSHIVSIGEPGSPVPEPLDPNDNRVLRLEFFDTGAFEYDPAGPEEEHVVALIDFFEGLLKDNGSALVHCAQGISRSSASALILLAMALGEGREQEAVYQLENLPGGERASPNTTIIELADDLLERGGELLEAMCAVYYSGSLE